MDAYGKGNLVNRGRETFEPYHRVGYKSPTLLMPLGALMEAALKLLLAEMIPS